MSELTQLSVTGGAPSFAPRVGKDPGFFSRSSSALLLVLLVAMEAGVVYFVIRDVRSANHEVQKMYASAVRGMRRIGSLQYEAQETPEARSTLSARTTATCRSFMQISRATPTVALPPESGIICRRPSYLANWNSGADCSGIGQTTWESGTRCWHRFWKVARKRP